MIPGLSVDIEYISDTDGGSIEQYVVPTRNNISDTSTTAGLNEESPGEALFILGASPLGSDDPMRATNIAKYKGFISQSLTGSDGSCNIQITVKGTGVNHFVIIFEVVLNLRDICDFIVDMKVGK
jgi:hypothetical protein